jgi:Cys-tRNA(Pro) deacylase
MCGHATEKHSHTILQLNVRRTGLTQVINLDDDADCQCERRQTLVPKDSVQYPVTAAIHFLREHEVPFEPRPYRYEEKGGTKVSSRELGVNENSVIKTLVMETDAKAPLVVLMHGDQNVSLKALARAIGVKTVKPCEPDVANRHSGYQVGGTSPFGMRKKMPLYLQQTIAELETIYINGGARGFLVQLSPRDLIRALQPTLVDVANPKGAK